MDKFLVPQTELAMEGFWRILIRLRVLCPSLSAKRPHSFYSPGHANPHFDLHFTKGKQQVASSNAVNYNRKRNFFLPETSWSTPSPKKPPRDLRGTSLLAYLAYVAYVAYVAYLAYLAYLASLAYVAYVAYLAYLSHLAYIAYLSYVAYVAYLANLAYFQSVWGLTLGSVVSLCIDALIRIV